MVLSAVLLLAFVLVFPTLHTYLQQRVELRDRQADLVAASQRNDDLREQLARWDDPAYLTAQARSRLSYVMPGETAYRIADPETVTGAAQPDEPDSSVVYPDAELPDQVRDPWYLRVWQSVNEAGGVTDAPAAATPGSKAPAPQNPSAPTPAAPTPTTPAPAGQEATP